MRFVVICKDITTDPCVRLITVPGVVVVRQFTSSKNVFVLVDYQGDLEKVMADWGPGWSCYPERTYTISNGGQ